MLAPSLTARSMALSQTMALSTPLLVLRFLPVFLRLEGPVQLSLSLTPVQHFGWRWSAGRRQCYCELAGAVQLPWHYQCRIRRFLPLARRSHTYASERVG